MKWQSKWIRPTTSTLALSTTSKRKSTVRAPMTNKAKRAFTAKPIKRQTAPIHNGTATLPTGFARHVKRFGVRIVVASVWAAISFAAAKSRYLHVILRQTSFFTSHVRHSTLLVQKATSSLSAAQISTFYKFKIGGCCVDALFRNSQFSAFLVQK